MTMAGVDDAVSEDEEALVVDASAPGVLDVSAVTEDEGDASCACASAMNAPHGERGNSKAVEEGVDDASVGSVLVAVLVARPSDEDAASGTDDDGTARSPTCQTSVSPALLTIPFAAYSGGRNPPQYTCVDDP